MALCLPVLFILNKRNVVSSSHYILIGIIIMWVVALKSGAHVTLAGVVLAIFIPLRSKSNPDHSPLKTL